MIILDTHVWIWWVHNDPRLPVAYHTHLSEREVDGLGISINSCWEVAKLVEYGRLALPLPVEDWMNRALSYPGMQLFDLTPRIVVEATQLPGVFHRDPADQMIVATARVLDCGLMTIDEKIVRYPHVKIEP